MGILNGKVAAITGGASGMGEAMAKLFLENGARVVIGDLDGKKAKATAAALSGTSPNSCVAVEIDVTSAADVECLVRTAEEKFGRLDIMCNNAGYAPDFLIHEM